jgi:hypothetical protein
MNLKIYCKTCDTKKNETEFYPYNFTECKKCVIERSTKYSKDNPERIKIAKEEYRKRNQKKINEYSLNYQRSHSKRICVQVQIRYYRKKLKDEFGIKTKDVERNEDINQMIKLHLELQFLYHKTKDERSK